MRASPGSRLLARTSVRLAPLVERLLKRPWPARVQRIGSQALQRVVARFPALAELVGAPHRQERNAEPKPALDVHERVTTHQPGHAAAAAIAQLTGDAPWQLRCQAAAALAQVDDPAALEALLDALRDPSAEVAAAAIGALAGRADTRVAHALTEILSNRDGYFSPVTRAAAVQGLARVLPDHELLPVIDAVTDVDAEVSLAAIASLAERAPAAAQHHLLPVLENQSGFFLPLVRLSAARALVKVNGLPPEVAARLLPFESDEGVRGVLASRTPLGAGAQS